MQEAGAETQQLVVGFPEEWQGFQKRQLSFLERHPQLQKALNIAFIRTAHFSEPIDKFVFLYGRLCSEDFYEVFLCCGNGYGQAALKLLRGFYEGCDATLFA